MENILLTIMRLITPPKRERPKVRHYVRTPEGIAPGQPPPDLEERYVTHHFGRVEPPDAWQID